MKETIGRSKKQESVPKVFAGLDIGSSKISFIIGQEAADGQIEIIGLGTAPSTGVRRGVIVNIEATIAGIQKAKEEAELMSGYKVNRALMSIGGSHIESFDSKGMVAISNHDVCKEDVLRVIDAAKAVAVPSDRIVLHILPKDYKVDEQDGISDPVGMSGVRLEASVHIITAGQTAMQNAMKCAERAGLYIESLVLAQLASSYAVLNEDEKKLGVALVDMGSGTTDVLIYNQGSVSFTASLPVGGQHITNDVAVGLRTPQQSAEEVKRKFGCALASLISADECIEVPAVAGSKARSILRQNLCEVIEPRAEETLNLIQSEIQRSGLMPYIGSGLVFTGGASQLEGLMEMAEFVFDMPVRTGTGHNVAGLKEIVKSPSYSTSVGLLLYAQKQNTKSALLADKENSLFDGIKKKLFGILGEANS